MIRLPVAVYVCPPQKEPKMTYHENHDMGSLVHSIKIAFIFRNKKKLEEKKYLFRIKKQWTEWNANAGFPTLLA